MLNNLKMDIRRLLHNKTFYLSLIIFLIFSGYCIYSQAKWQVINGYQIPTNLQLEPGLYSIVNHYLNMPIQYMYIFTFKNGLIIFGIYVVTFIASEYQSGFIKNSCMMCKNKGSIIWNKLNIIMIISILITLLSLLLTITFGYLFVDDFIIGNIVDILIFSGISIMFYIAYFLGIIFLYRLIGSKIPSILVSVFLPLGLMVSFLNPIFGEVTKYTLSGLLFEIPMNFESSSSIEVIVVLIFLTAIYQGLSIFLFRKRDI